MGLGDHTFKATISSRSSRGHEKVLAWAAGRPVLKVEFWYVFEHVIKHLCEKEVFKKCWHGELAGQFWRSSFGMFFST